MDNPIDIAPAPSLSPGGDPARDRLEVLLRVHDQGQYWIGLADTKAGLLLTLNGILVGVMVPQMVTWKHAWSSDSSALGLGLSAAFFLGYAFCQLLSFFFTVRVFVPRILKAVDSRLTRHIFNASIARNFPEPVDGSKFHEEYNKLNLEDLLREYALQVHINALISNRKYGNLLWGLKAVVLAMILALMTVVVNIAMLKP